jgi:hypothetical protein
LAGGSEPRGEWPTRHRGCGVPVVVRWRAGEVVETRIGAAAP